MNGLEEIQKSIKNFICEKEQMQQQISEIEEKRAQLAKQRNEKKESNSDWLEINDLGKQISELGNQSKELQNSLDSNWIEVKSQISLVLDNLVAEGIRKIRKVEEEIQQLENRIEEQKERSAKYEFQKQEFFERFGRMPELSDIAAKESKLQEKDTTKSELEIIQLKEQVSEATSEITVLAKVKRDIKYGNLNAIVEDENNDEEFIVEELNVEEMEPIEEIVIEDIEPIEELYIEEFKPIEEIKIEEFKPEENVEKTVMPIEMMEENVEQNSIDEVEELARAIVEEIASYYQTKSIEITEEPVSVENVKEDDKEDIIVFEKEEEEEVKPKVKIPLFGQKATITNIIVKFDDGELVYKAQMSDGEEIKIYPSKLGEESVLLRDKQNREECKEILINYAVSEYKTFDKKVVNKIDPLICELLIECAERYNYETQKLIYNYAMSFSDSEENDVEKVPGIIYNLSYIEESNLTRKEKAVINKICKDARKNSGIDIIEKYSGFRKIKYVLKRLFTANNVKVLPEAKY